MRATLEGLMLVLALGAAVAIAAKRVRVPYNVALVVVGLLAVLFRLLPKVPLDPEVVLVGILPVLVFEGALFANIDHLRHARRPILTLAIPGVAISLFGTATLATRALSLPFGVALVLGAILAITDTVSVLLAFRTVRVPARLAAIMEGESLFNDGTALVLVATTAAIAAGAEADATRIAGTMVVAIVGGVLFGLAAGSLGAVALRATPDHLTAVLVTIVVVFAASLAAEEVHASPVIAVVVVGVVVGRAARRTLPPSRVLALHGFWETVGFGLNVIVFLVAGMQIDTGSLVAEAGSIALALAALHVGRALAVFGGLGLLRLVSQERVPLRWQQVMVLGNIKGALSMAAVLALPADVPSRERLVTIVFGVTFVTLLTQALPFARALRWLGVVSGPARPEVHAARAALIGARRGLRELEALHDAGLVSAGTNAAERARLQRTVIAAERTLRETGDDDDERSARAAVLEAERAALAEAQRRGILDEGTAEARMTEIDEQRLSLREEHEP